MCPSPSFVFAIIYFVPSVSNCSFLMKRLSAIERNLGSTAEGDGQSREVTHE